jgi:pyruvate/2-oxoglutarate dehydrogenase complex dihydrolipoamide acyltransferase (E2) component
VDSAPLLEDVAGQVGETTQRTGDVSNRATNETADEIGWTVDGSGNAAETPPDKSNEVDSKEKTGSLADLRIEEEYVDERGRIVGRARDESGNVVEEVLDQEGEILVQNVSEEAEGRESEDDAEADATEAARRKADELGVKLPDIKGTGSGGRILVRDVEKTSRRAESSA